MKDARALALLLVLSLVAGFASVPVAMAVGETTTVEFDIYGMHSPSCSAQIRGAVEELAGIESIEVDHEKDWGKVEFDPDKISVEEIEVTIEDLGYGAELRTDE